MNEEDTNTNANLIGLTTDIVAAYVSNNPVPATELPRLIADTHAAIAGLKAGATAEQSQEKTTPAGSVANIWQGKRSFPLDAIQAVIASNCSLREGAGL